MKKNLFILFYIIISLASIKADQKTLIYKINIKEEIGSASWSHLKNGLYQAQQKQANYVILHLNTYGGFVIEADSMRTAILNCKIPVIAFIDNNAASAGALIATACDSIYMSQSATIGAATVVTQTGEKAPDKYQSYMRALMRSTAESHGRDTIITAHNDTIIQWKRNPLIAEAMVDERVVVPILTDTTKVLTLTSTEAIEIGYANGIVENISDIISNNLHIKSYELDNYNPTPFDHIKDFLMNSIVQSLLIMVIFGGVYLELKTPGIGAPICLAIAAALLYFTPLYMDGYAQNWEILLFVLGLILLAFEIFVIPGFGVAGITGITLIVLGLFLSLLGNVNLNFDGISTSHALKSLLTVTIGIILGFALIIFLLSRVGKKGSLLNHIALNADQEGFSTISSTIKQMIGKIGIASTILRPSGKVIIDSNVYDAVALQGYIDKDKKIKVVKYENAQLYVVEIKE